MSTGYDRPASSKAALRAEYKQRRNALGTEERLVRSVVIRTRLLELPEVHEARTIFCFISHGTEVDTRGLVEELRRQGKVLVIPRILPERRMIAVTFSGWDDLAPGTLGIPAPRDGEEVRGGIDLCITPGIAFTVSGKRLGHGRGYYDRWLADHRPIRTVAPAFECQLAPDLPVEPHDISIDALVTENRLLRFRA